MSGSSQVEETPVVRQFVNLICGLFVVCGLLYISAIALSVAWLGVVIGAVELAVAWRVSPPADLRVLRWITGAFGAFSLAFPLFVLVAR